jgi:MscS family membrane protein
VSEGLHVGLLLTVLWFATRAADIAGDAAILRAKAAGNIGTASVLPLIVRASKIGLVALGLISVLSTMGYPVSSLLAGLGIGGLALALAAQKTAENVFGSVSISIDQPFRVGDLVKIDELIGVVERIGLRSTSIRTAERTLITWPNGKLADLRVENYAARDRLRFSSTFALALDTPRANLEAAVAAIEARLAAEPSVWPSDATARVTRVTPTAIEVEVAAWLLATPDAFTLVKQSLILDILATLAATHVHLARPPEPLRV